MSHKTTLLDIVVQVSRDGQTGSGTGFYIAEDLIVTCHHVLVKQEGIGSLEDKYWVRHDDWGGWEEAEPVDEYCHPGPRDTAILRCSRSANGTAGVRFANWDKVTDFHFVSRGYDADKNRWGVGASTIEGEVKDLTALSWHPRLRLDTKPGTVASGRSGSPVWSERQQAIVGIIDWAGQNLGRERGDEVLAIPISEIRNVASDEARIAEEIPAISQQIERLYLKQMNEATEKRPANLPTENTLEIAESQKKKAFSPEKFVDRKREQKLFDDCLNSRATACFLTIRDAGGNGKSDLLEMFRHNCLWTEKPTPVCLIPFDQWRDESNLFNLIYQVRLELSDLEGKYDLELPFAKFDPLNEALSSRDFERLSQILTSDQTLLSRRDQRELASAMPREGDHQKDDRSASYEMHDAGERIGKVDDLFDSQTDKPEYPSLSDSAKAKRGTGGFTKPYRSGNNRREADWASAKGIMEEMARRGCVNAFLQDLKQICDEQPVVVLFDAWDKCGESLRSEILDEVIREFCFNPGKRPEKFILVLAGKELPDFRAWLGRDDMYEELFSSIERLSIFREGDLKHFLQKHGHEAISNDDKAVEFLHDRIRNKGVSLLKVLQLARDIDLEVG